MKYDILFGSVALVGGLLKQLLVSFQLPQISRAFFLLNKGIEHEVVDFVKSADWHQDHSFLTGTVLNIILAHFRMRKLIPKCLNIVTHRMND